MQVRVILVEPEHEGNIGSIARVMKNFGFCELWIVNPKTDVGSQARAYASHAQEILQQSRTVETIEEAFEGCSQVAGTTAVPGRRPSNVLRTTLSPEKYACMARRIKERIGLVFGRESLGLSNEELDKCDTLITIPASRRYGTLNVAMACTIVLYELRKHLHHAERTIQLSDPKTNSRLVRYFERLAGLSRTPRHRQKLAVRAFRNVLSRGLLTKREALLLIGIVRRACFRDETGNPNPVNP